jgi:hypothetical protein
MAIEMQAFSIPRHLKYDIVDKVKNNCVESTQSNDEVLVLAENTRKASSESFIVDDGDHVFVEQPRQMNLDEPLEEEAWYDDMNIAEGFHDTQDISFTGSSSRHGNVEVCIAPKVQHERSCLQQPTDATFSDKGTSMNSKFPQEHQNITMVQPLHHRIHDHRPKAVMTILSARLIDVTTLRDIHVGLPKGTHGFVFSGRQIFSEMQSAWNDNDSNDVTNVGHHTHDTQSLSDEHFEINGDICHPLSSILNVNEHYFDTSRDYLCSVSTQEEAKQWVAALKWAAKVAANSSNNDIGKRSLQNICQNSQSNSTSLRIGESESLPADSSRDLVNSLLSDSTTSTVLTDSWMPCGYTVVTKVKNVSVGKIEWIRLLGIKCELLFEIRLLLLSPNQILHRSAKRRIDENDDSFWGLEQRTIYRNFVETVNFASLFTSNLQADASLKDVIMTMEKMSFSNIITLKKNLMKSIECVDTALRIITSDRQLCDSRVVKQFLGLSSHPLGSESDQLVNKGSTHLPRVLNVGVGQCIDDVVTDWIHGERERLKTSEKLRLYSMLILRNPIVESILSVKIAYVAKCALKFWWTHPCIISIRADALLTLFSGFFYIGYNMGCSKINKKNKCKNNERHGFYYEFG